MGNTCAPQKGLRFKNFVIAVYPDDPEDGPVRDALGKLQNYIASNPERIPRVCRKISKLLVIYLKRGKVQRVMVGVHMLRDLIAHSDDVSGFVPHCISICSMLFSYPTLEYRIGAAEVLTTLCYKLAGRADGENSCRLIADGQDKLIPPLESMCLETVPNDQMATMRCRYTALVALGSIMFSLEGSLADVVQRLLTPFLSNLLHLMRNGGKREWLQQQPVAELLQHIKDRPFNAVSPPAGDEWRREIACISAAAWGIGAAVGCVSTAGIHQFLQQVSDFVTSNDGWSPPAFACITFRSLARAMEWRPQELGFTVCQFLCGITVPAQIEEPRRSQLEEGIITSLIVCTNEVRMTGGRPEVLFEFLRKCVNRAKRTNEYSNLYLELLATLMYRTHRWGNAPQLHLLLVKLIACVKEMVGDNVLWGLQVLTVAAPYVRVVPLIDRGDINVYGTISPFLATHDEAQAYAAEVLVGLLAGTISPRGPAHADGGPPDAAPLVTDERDAALAECWAHAVIGSEKSVTSSCVVEVGRVVAAVLQSRGAAALPFALSVAWRLQSFVSNGGKKVAELHVAWAHLSLAVLANCGAVLALPELSRYAAGVMNDRHHARELAPQFAPRVSAHNGGALQLVVPRDGRLLSRNPPSCAPVTVLVDFARVADIIARDAAMDVFTAFGARNEAGLKAAVNECYARSTGDVVTPRACSRERRAVSLVASLATANNRATNVTISVMDGGEVQASLNGVTTASGSGARGVGDHHHVDMGTASARIANLLARHGISATTQLLPNPARTRPLASLTERGELTEEKRKDFEACEEDEEGETPVCSKSCSVVNESSAMSNPQASTPNQHVRKNNNNNNNNNGVRAIDDDDGPQGVVTPDAIMLRMQAPSISSEYSAERETSEEMEEELDDDNDGSSKQTAVVADATSRHEGKSVNKYKDLP